MDISELLPYLATGGSVVVANWFASWYLESTDFWTGLSSKAKSGIILLISAAIGILAQLAIANPAFIESVKPYLQTIIFAIGGWLSSQSAHASNEFRQ